MTTWACVTPKTAFVSLVPSLLLMLAAFVILPKDQLPERQESEIKHKGRKYLRLESSEDSQEPCVKSTCEISWREKLSVAREIYPLISFLFCTYYVEYLANNAVITTLAFSDAPFSPRDHYLYYMLVYDVGKFLGRSHILIASGACPKAISYIRVRKTWILASVECLHLLFFIMASWFRFLSSVWIVVILCFTEGFVAGSIYVNSAHTVSEQFSDLHHREFALSLLMVGNEVGILSAGFMGLYVEPILKANCFNYHDNELYCLTRYRSAASWHSSKKCNMIGPLT